MKKYLIFFAISLISVLAFSQSEFEAGTLINQNNVSKNVLIKNEEWTKNPDKFYYKTSDISEIQIAQLDNTNEIFVDNKFKFIKAIVEVDINGTSSNISNYGKSREPKFNQEETFLNVLVEGEISLLEYNSNNISYFYLLLDNGEIIPLIYKKYLSSRDSNKVLENNRYKNQLSNYLKSDKLSSEDFIDVDYYKSDLTKIMETYYSATGKEHIVYKNKKDFNTNKKKFAIRPEVGVSFNSASFQDDARHVDEFSFDSEMTPILGVEFEYFLPFNNNKWSLFSEISYSNYNNTVLQSREGSVLEDIDEISLDYSFISLNIGPRHYFYFSKNSALYFDASLNIRFPIGNSILKNEPYSGQAGGHVAYEIEASSIISGGVGVGFLYKKFNLELLYNLTGTMSSREYLDTVIKHGYTSLKIGYQIFTKYE